MESETTPLYPQSPWIQHCRGCTSHCCYDSLVVLTATDRKKLLDAGHPDYSIPVVVKNIEYYVLDFQDTPAWKERDEHKPCPYLDDDRKCSAYDARPRVCQAFPIAADYTSLKKCPVVAAKQLPADFVKTALEVVDDFRKEIDSVLYNEIIDHYAEFKRTRFDPPPGPEIAY